MKAQAGKVYKIFFNKGNVNNRTIHVLAVVENMIVVKWWSGSTWKYELMNPYLFVIFTKEGNLTESKVKFKGGFGRWEIAQ